MLTKAPCKICRNDADHVADTFFPSWKCTRCGEFAYDATIGWAEIKTAHELVQLSGWVREQNSAGLVPVRITRDSARRVMRRRMPLLLDRADMALALIAE